jgi:pyruvate dehydrogenase E1 component alpha subunit
VADTKTKKRPGKKDALAAHGVSADVALKLMRQMLLYRRFEEKAEEGYATGSIGGFCHLHIGQEAAAAGSIGALRLDDYVISSYRSHTQAIAKGVQPNAVMAELYGRVGGSSGGKGGSMHIFGAAVRFMGGHGIVGAQVPLATGYGWKIKYRGEDSVVVCFIGDAAVNQGAFHESLNMADIWDLPVIYVVEHNEYGMGTAFNRVSTTDMEEKSSPHGITGVSVDGQDVLATYSLFKELVADVRSGSGPKFVNLETYRFRGHSMSDPVSGTYRSTEEVDLQKKHKDPISILKEKLFSAGVLDQQELQEMETEARRIVSEAVDFAENSPVPSPDALYANVWADVNPHGRLFFDSRSRD